MMAAPLLCLECNEPKHHLYIFILFFGMGTVDFIDCPLWMDVTDHFLKIKQFMSGLLGFETNYLE